MRRRPVMGRRPRLAQGSRCTAGDGVSLGLLVPPKSDKRRRCISGPPIPLRLRCQAGCGDTENDAGGWGEPRGGRGAGPTMASAVSSLSGRGRRRCGHATGCDDRAARGVGEQCLVRAGIHRAATRERFTKRSGSARWPRMVRDWSGKAADRTARTVGSAVRKRCEGFTGRRPCGKST